MKKIRILAMIMALVMCFGLLAGCGSKDNAADEKITIAFIGNTTGDIYKLTWYVKDDALLRTDTYSLCYTVTVDTAEEGYVAGTDYPANGYTDLTYTVGLNSEEYGVGFRKGSELADALNTFFAEAYADGSMMAAAEKYGVQAAVIAQ